MIESDVVARPSPMRAQRRPSLVARRASCVTAVRERVVRVMRARAFHGLERIA